MLQKKRCKQSKKRKDWEKKKMSAQQSSSYEYKEL